MTARRDDLHGILVVDKPVGPTSMDVIRRVRPAVGGSKTGHAGTLDPLASGVLVVCIGDATKYVDQIMAMTKVYQTTIDLSAFTATDDAQGQREVVEVGQPPTTQQVRAALDQLTGEIAQAPPPYSAVKVGGQRAYKLARRGHNLTMPPRLVRIDRIDINHFDWPTLSITVTCGKGTYIRSLARQIGQLLATGGYLTALRRTAVGQYTIDNAIPLDAVPNLLNPSQLLPAPTPNRQS